MLHQPLLEALTAMDRVTAARIIQEHRDAHGILAVSDQLITPSFEQLGEAWDRGDASLAEVFMAGRICEDIVMSYLRDEGAVCANSPRIGIGVLEDSHALGKRIVTSVLRASGYSVQDYGTRLDAVDLADKAVDDGADVLLVSTLMLRAALQVERLVHRARSRGFSGPIFVGGAPFRMDPLLWRDMGADGMGRTASDALSLVARLKVGRT